eukprot:10959589-Heterocapsa_arctica.AAC.1
MIAQAVAAAMSKYVPKAPLIKVKLPIQRVAEEFRSMSSNPIVPLYAPEHHRIASDDGGPPVPEDDDDDDDDESDDYNDYGDGDTHGDTDSDDDGRAPRITINGSTILPPVPPGPVRP